MSPISSRICVPNVAAVRRSCRKRGGGTDRQTDKWKLQLYRPIVDCVFNSNVYIVQVFEIRTEWAVCYRQELAIRGNNTNNFVEAAMRILKDKVVERVRAYNPIQLLDFMITRHDGMLTSHCITLRTSTSTKPFALS